MKDGSVYVGQAKNNVLDGEHTYFKPDGTSYKTEFKEGRQLGEDVLIEPANKF